MRNITASSTGRYSASFAAGQCDDGATVVVVATSSDGTSSGQATSTMGGAGGTPQRVEVDIALAAPVPLPEFVPLTVVLALFAATAIVTFARRKEFERPPPKE